MRTGSRLFAHLLVLFAAGLLAGATPAAATQDGLPDTTFGGGDGIVGWAGSATISIQVADAVATGEGALIGVGTFIDGTAPPALHFRSFQADGSGGAQFCYLQSSDLFPATTESHGRSAIIDAVGDLLVGGSATVLGTESVSRALVARFRIDQAGCVLDASFSTTGWQILDGLADCDPEDCQTVALAEIEPATQAVSAPRILALVESRVSVSTAELVLVALTASGAPEPSFGVGGNRRLVSSQLGYFYPGTAQLGLDGRGRIYVLASHFDPGAQDDLDPVFLRLTADGDFDSTFGTGGILPTLDSDTDDSVVRDMDVRPAGAIAFATQGVGTGNGRTCVVSFPSPPTCTTNSASEVRDVLWQGDGKVLDSFEPGAEDGVRIRRMTGSLLADPTFGPGGGPPQVDPDLGGANGQTAVEMLLSAGQPVLAGSADLGSGRTAGFLARLTNSFLFADDFEGGTPALWSHETP